MTDVHETLRRYGDFAGLDIAAWRAFILDADEGALPRVVARPAHACEQWLWEDLIAALATPSEFRDVDRRVLAALGAIDPATRGGAAPISFVARWLSSRAPEASPDEQWLHDTARALGLTPASAAELAIACAHGLSSAVRTLLALDDDALAAAVRKSRHAGLGTFQALARAAPARFGALMGAILDAQPAHLQGVLLATGASVLPRAALPGLTAEKIAPDARCFVEHLAPASTPPFSVRFEACGDALRRRRILDPAAWAALRALVLDDTRAGATASAPPIALRVDVAHELCHTLPLPRSFDAQTARLAHALVTGGQLPLLLHWADGALRAEAEGEDVFAVVEAACAAAPAPGAHAAFAHAVVGVHNARGVTSYGRWILSRTDDELALLLDAQLEARCWNTLVFMIVAQEAPARVPLLVAAIERAPLGAAHRANLAIETLVTSRSAAARDAAAALDRARVHSALPPTSSDPTRAHERASAMNAAFTAHKRLVARDRRAHLDGAIAMARELLHDQTTWHVGEASQWLLRTLGGDARAELTALLTKIPTGPSALHVATQLLTAFGPNAPEAVAFYLAQAPYLQLTALQRLTNAGVSIEDARVAGTLTALLGAADLRSVPQALELAARTSWPWTEPRAWDLLASKSSRVRAAAARALAAHRGDDTWARAVTQLAHKQAPARLGAIALLALLDARAATELFEVRVDAETNEDVRDQLLIALKDVWQAAGRVASWSDVEKRVVKAKKPRALAPWLDIDKLPPLHLLEGRLVPPAAIAWMLARQARVSGVRPDLDAEVLYGLVDRKTSGDFALALLDGFLRGGALAEERFVLTVVAVLGDARVVPPLTTAVHEWVRDKRAAFAEYGVQALALLGHDAALKAVDDLGLRYAHKPKNLGDIAADAFADAAEQQGVTVDELRDRIVPWLGFLEDGSPRVVDIGGGKRVALGIDDHFQVTLRDADSNKAIRSIPTSAPAEVKDAIKELREQVRDAAKLQSQRLENLMVVGTRWSRERFDTMFLRHPLLAPFSRRLVWIAEPGAITCHADGRGALVGSDGARVSLPADARLGVAHPLALDDDDRAAWSARLGDQPFPQLARPVARPAEDERAQDAWHGVTGKEVASRAMKGRSARLGWRRGHSSGGYVHEIYKAFPFAGVVAHLALEDMPVVLDMSASCTVRELSFVRPGSGRVPLAEVHPIAFSEAVADAAALAG